MSQLLRLRFSRGRATLARNPDTVYMCSCAAASHKISSYRGMLVRAHLRVCSSLEHQLQVPRSGWHLKGQS